MYVCDGKENGINKGAPLSLIDQWGEGATFVNVNLILFRL